MDYQYKIHFGYSKRSKFYLQALELAELAYNHQVTGTNEDKWHTIILKENQIDLLALIFKLAKKLPYPKKFGVDVQYLYVFCLSGENYKYIHSPKSYQSRLKNIVKILRSELGNLSYSDLANYINHNYIEPINNDMKIVEELLIREGKIDYIDRNTQTLVKAKNPPKEQIVQYQKIIDLISDKRFSEAIYSYYKILGEKYYNELISELIYLKRLAKIELTGRDLLYFRQDSSRSELISQNIPEYVDCIDMALERLREYGRKTPLDIILEYAPTMEDLIAQKVEKINRGVRLSDGIIHQDNIPIDSSFFTYKFDFCHEGRLFQKYPDQVLYCRIYDYFTNPRFKNLWVIYSPDFIQKNILDKDLHINYIDAYCHKSKLRFQNKWKNEINFQSLLSTQELTKDEYSTSGIKFTGNKHTIENIMFYEIDLIRDIDEKVELENPFIELVGEILREAENILRENHGLPRIGEGWVSETQMYELIKTLFLDAVQHSSPEWLKPQHLDVLVPSKKIAFEYQGKQHYEPIEFFGGNESYKKIVLRDKIKVKKCRKNGINLIKWNYYEPINHEILLTKLEKNNVPF